MEGTRNYFKLFGLLQEIHPKFRPVKRYRSITSKERVATLFHKCYKLLYIGCTEIIIFSNSRIQYELIQCPNISHNKAHWLLVWAKLLFYMFLFFFILYFVLSRSGNFFRNTLALSKIIITTMTNHLSKIPYRIHSRLPRLAAQAGDVSHEN